MNAVVLLFAATTTMSGTTTGHACATQLNCRCQTNSDCKDWQGGNAGYCDDGSCVFCGSACLGQDNPGTDISGASCVDVCCTAEMQTTDFWKSLCVKHGAALTKTTTVDHDTDKISESSLSLVESTATKLVVLFFVLVCADAFM